MRRTRIRLFAPVLAGLLVFAGAIQLIAPLSTGAIDMKGGLGDPVATAGYVSLTSLPRGGTAQIAIEVDIDHPWHINANELEDEFMVPTELEFDTPAGITIKGIVYPDPVTKALDFSDTPLRLYAGKVYIGAVIEIAPDFETGDAVIKGRLTYQACDNEKCLMPKTVDVFVPFKVSTRRETIDAAHTEIFSMIKFEAAGDSGDKKGGSGFGGIVARRGMFIAFLIVFLGGLALNLTPCVYPIIPITVSYFGGQASGSKSSTIVLALLYLLGMAAMYSTLGVIAALTGSILGSALQNPLVTAVVASVMVLLALSMFGVYEIRVPARLSGVAGTAKKGYAGAFLMGLTVGIVAAPCIGPFVLGLLTFVGERGDPAMGFAIFLTLSIGLGLPYVFLAMASGSITKLPKSGEWMEWVRKLFGLILLAMAVYFLDPVLPETAYYILLGGLLAVGGLIMGFVLKVVSTSRFFNIFRPTAGIGLVAAGLWFVFAPGHILGITPGIPWLPYDDDHLVEARSKNLPVVIDFSAEWCLPCEELDHETFNQPEVIQAAKKIMPLRADLTQSGSQEVVDLRIKYGIRGVPTIVFLDGNGKERTELRVVQFIEKEEFLEKLAALTGGSP
jgi:thiol:disulfide interchange protein DsbD